jgi:hypothetical protein
MWSVTVVANFLSTSLLSSVSSFGLYVKNHCFIQHGAIGVSSGESNGAGAEQQQREPRLFVAVVFSESRVVTSSRVVCCDRGDLHSFGVILASTTVVANSYPIGSLCDGGFCYYFVLGH